MGCDIHMTLERRIEGVWHCIWDGDVRPRTGDHKGTEYQPVVARDRNYAFFGRLAGVRTDGPGPKGVPTDVSVVTRRVIDIWDCDGHSHSWDTLEDFCNKWAFETPDEEKVQFVKDTLTEKYVTPVYERLFGLYEEQEPENVRVVYWFDN